MARKKASGQKKVLPMKQTIPWKGFVIAGVVIILLGSLVAIFLGGDETPTQTQITPQATGGGPRLAVQQTVVDEGDVKINNEVQSTFQLQNVGDEPLQILGEPQVELVEGC